MEKYVTYMKKIIGTLHLERILMKDTKTLEMVEILYRRQDKRAKFTEIWCRRLFVLTIVIGVALLILIACFGQDAPEGVIVNETYLHIGAGEEQVTFGVEAETEAGPAKEEISIGVGPKEERSQREEELKTPDPREVFMADVREAVENAVASERIADGEQDVMLPDMVSGNEVRYVNPEYKKDYNAFYLCLLVICLLPVLWRRERQDLLKEREDQLLLAYPELVNKVMLLLSAGLTVRGSLERICDEYRDRIQKGGERKYVYEEVCFSVQEMEHGMSETMALESFGKRCRLLPYLRFASMMNQNIRKGSEGLIQLLEVEAIEAFEKRKEQVKVMGETAGTKLLLPMILMLGVVMVIIVIPAFMTM